MPVCCRNSWRSGVLPGRKFDLMRNPKSRAATALLSFLAAAALSVQQAPIRAEAAPTVMADAASLMLPTTQQPLASRRLPCTSTMRPSERQRDAFPEVLPWKGGSHLYGINARVVRLAPERASRIKPGDILRIRKNTHSAVLIQVDGDTLTVCEGNNYGTVHWGRKISASSLAGDITYVERRYVMDSEETAATGQ